MSPALITLLILAVAIVLFMTERLRVDIVALGVIISLLAFGIVTTNEAIGGFSSTAVISIAALFIVGGAVFQTGLASQMAQVILRLANGNGTRLLVVLMVSAAILSAFISSTGVVALLLPSVISLSKTLKIPPSQLLIPLAYSALVGGSLTLIGTPPNLIVSETLANAGYAPFSLFSFTPMGLVLLAIGVGYVMLVGRHWLPSYNTDTLGTKNITPHEVLSLIDTNASIARVIVGEASSAIGKTLSEIALRREFGVSLLDIERPIRPNGNGFLSKLGASKPKSTLLYPSADLALHANDRLMLQGEPEAIGYACQVWGWQMQEDVAVEHQDMLNPHIGIAELVISPHSSLIGKTLTDMMFGSTYHVTVLGFNRPNTTITDITHTPLEFGDMLIVQGTWDSLTALAQQRRDFVVISDLDSTQFGAFARSDKAQYALFWLGLMVGIITLGIADLTLASLIAAVGMVLSGCLTMDEAYESIDWKSLVLIAGMIPMSIALTKVGIVDSVAQGLVGGLGQFGALAIFASICVLTALFTQVLSNTATVLLIAPLAVTTAQALGVQPQAFLLGVALSASMAFATPIASPVNTLVMSAGSYQFKDYMRVGLPLIVLCLVAVVLILPILYPL